MNLLQIDQAEFFYNIHWHNFPGEIDVVLMKNNKIIGIVEIKAKCFDLYYGYL